MNGLFDLVGEITIAQAMVLAAEHGTTVEEELVASGNIDETTYYEALAEKLGLDFLPEIDPSRVQDLAGLDSQITRPEMLRVHHASRPPVTVIVPTLARPDDLTWCTADPGSALFVWNSLIGPWSLGSEIALPSGAFSVAERFDLIDRLGGTVLCPPASEYGQMAGHDGPETF